MASAENPPAPASTALDDVYDPDDVGLRDSPLLKPMRPSLQPSPSPPPTVPLPQGGPNSGQNQGDAVLVSFMDGGKHPDIARQAGNELLASIDEGAVESVKGTEVTVEKKAIDLTTLATEALKAHEVTAAQGTS
ncbi:hypothetical protein BGZ57DRAFT_980008 [Hyaloscypha finlandica]|nr:hypothetical protein BGZ57DRAFT_980008 [Hyaloscypha finlandica]